MRIADTAASLDAGGFTTANAQVNRPFRFEPAILSWFKD
jgi:hypothetical protein